MAMFELGEPFLSKVEDEYDMTLAVLEAGSPHAVVMHRLYHTYLDQHVQCHAVGFHDGHPVHDALLEKIMDLEVLMERATLAAWS